MNLLFDAKCKYPIIESVTEKFVCIYFMRQRRVVFYVGYAAGVGKHKTYKPSWAGFFDYNQDIYTY